MKLDDPKHLGDVEADDFDLDDRPLPDEQQSRRRLWETVDPRYTLLSLTLEGRDANFKSEVYEMVDNLGIEPDDPLFLPLMAVGHVETLLKEHPDLHEQFKQQLEQFKQDLRSLQEQSSDWIVKNLEAYEQAVKTKLDSLERTAAVIHRKAMSRTVDELVRKVSVREVLTHPFTLIRAGGIFLLILLVGAAIGGVVGVIGTLVRQQVIPLDPEAPRRLTTEQVEALRWAQSAEGKYAKHLIEWNRDLLADNNCQREVKRLGVVWQQNGREATRGFCPLWTVPPHERQFK